MLVRRLLVVGRHRDDHGLHQFGPVGIGPEAEILEAGLLDRLPQGDGEGVDLAGVTVAADLHPGLLAFVPTQQHPLGRRMHDQGRSGQVQGRGAVPR